MNKNQKGITLIALIITIIVMLVLVAVTINVALNGGLFEKAKTASLETQKQADKEELLSAILGAYNVNDGTIDVGELRERLSSGWQVTGAGPYICISEFHQLMFGIKKWKNYNNNLDVLRLINISNGNYGGKVESAYVRPVVTLSSNAPGIVFN